MNICEVDVAHICNFLSNFVNICENSSILRTHVMLPSQEKLPNIIRGVMKRQEFRESKERILWPPNLVQRVNNIETLYSYIHVSYNDKSN